MDFEKMAAAVGDMLSKRLAPLRKAVTQVADSLAAVNKRLEAVEERQAEDVTQSMLSESVAQYLKENPPKPGKDADPVEITHEDIAKALREDPALLQDVVEEYFQRNPAPAGKDAAPITDEQIERAITRHLEKHPVPAGKDADPITDAQIDKAVGAYLKANPPEPGQDGVGVAGATINRGGHLVLTTSDGRTHDLGEVVGKDGTDWEGAQIDYDGERSLILRAKDGSEKILKTSMPIDRGYWRRGDSCEKGDMVTHDGSLWMCLQETKEKPGYGKDEWRLAARKGKDGTTVVKYKEDKDPEPVKLKDKAKDDETDD